MTLNLFVVFSSLTIYILIGIYFEERKLLREFGQQYADYKSTTPMLLPRLPKIPRPRRNSAGTNDFYPSS
jgi:protein-S-isoprenylcysteine O-methyltransferase Ste14